MKFKNNYPGKIWAKSDHWFQSYGQKCIKNRLLGTVLEPDQLPGSRLTGFYQLPGSENRNRPIPSYMSILVFHKLYIDNLYEILKPINSLKKFSN